MNTPVNFEIAKLLKEKGFDTIDCSGYYHICDGYTKGYSHCYSDVNTQKEDAILAPTIAEVVMWLYENHRIWIYVIYDKGLFHNNIEDTTYKDLSEEDCRFFNMSSYNSPTEAYEAAIKYTLENIK